MKLIIPSFLIYFTMISSASYAAAVTIKMQIELPETQKNALGNALETSSPQTIAQLLEILAAVAKPSQPPAPQDLVHHFIHGLHTLQAQINDLMTQIPDNLAPQLADILKSIDELIEHQTDRTSSLSEVGVITRGPDPLQAHREKLNFIISQLEKVVAAVGSSASNRALNFDALEETENISITDMLRAIYHKLHAIAG